MMIALCDDDLSVLNQLSDMLGEAKQERDTVTAFSSGLDLLENADRGYPFDVTFLDIRMPGLDGLEVARDIRAAAPCTALVMLTKHQDYALNAYEVHPYDYLLKPVTIKRLEGILSEIRATLRESESYTFTYGYEAVTLPLRMIRYIESRKWMAMVHCGGGHYQLNERLKNICGDLEPKGFVRVHQSYLVNAVHIRKVNRQARTLTLASGETIPISEHKVAETAEWFLQRRTGVI